MAAGIDDQTVAVILQPIQGEAEVIPATVEFISALGELTRDKKLLLIFDEV